MTVLKNSTISFSSPTHPDTQCLQPFIRLEIAYQGTVWLCCSAWLPREIGNIMTSDLLDLWNGPVAQDIRKSVRDGSYSYCTQCPFLPGPQGTVVPWGEPPSTKRINNLYLSYDRMCNLACPSCRKSHFILSTYEKETIKTIQDRLLSSNILDYVDILHLSGGGDPLASPYGRALLQHLTPEKYPSLKIGLLTNGLLCTPTIWKTLATSVNNIYQIQISIDASSAKTYELNRGGDWNQLCSNLNFLNNERQTRESVSGKASSFELHFMFVVQENNFMEMPAFMLFAAEYQADRIAFLEIRNWFKWLDNSKLDTDYAERAIHLPSHPRYNEFKRMFNHIKSEPCLAKVFHPNQIDWLGFNQLKG